MDHAAVVSALFEVVCHTTFGEEVRIVGSNDQLGKWDPKKGCRLHTDKDSFPVWRSSPLLLNGNSVEYKYVIVKSESGEAVWDQGDNRRIDVQAIRKMGATDGFLFIDRWGEPRSHRLVPTRMLSYEEEDSDSEMTRRHSLSTLWKSNSVSEMEKSWRKDVGVGSPNRANGVDTHHADSRCSWMHHVAQDGHGVPEGSWPRVPMRDILNSSSGHGQKRKHIVTIHAPRAKSVELTGTFTSPHWRDRWPLYRCPRTGVFWISLQDVVGDVDKGTFYFQFTVLKSEDWSEYGVLSDSFPKSVSCPVSNVLHIDRKLRGLIQQQKQIQLEVETPAVHKREPEEEPHIHGYPARRTMTRLPVLPTDTVGNGDEADDSNRAFRSNPIGAGPHLPVSDQSSQPSNFPMRKAVSMSEGMFKPDAEKPKPDSITLRGQRPVVATEWNDKVTGRLFDRSIPLLLSLPEEERKTKLKFFSGASCLPKPGSDGEDAFFTSSKVLAVADGVGGMQAILGHSSKAFAEELVGTLGHLGCQTCSEGFEDNTSIGHEAVRLLDDAFNAMETNGASTAVSVLLDGDVGRAGITSLGDSGVLVIRRNRTLFRTSPQQHSLNWPYQLCRVPAEVVARHGGGASFDSASDANSWDIDLQEGDLLLVYSDGLDDNLFDYEVLELCQRALSPYAAKMLDTPNAWTHPGGLAKSLALAAHARAEDEKAKTPFGNQAKRAGWPAEYWRGGKMDDCTVVCAWVVAEDQDLEQNAEDE
mmetsp:Transcript_39645/g.95207  ORF Transcript_39645/g.95207 Transcript_39645/m.95207 type:complete len:753 (-) Transcript_39645:221-2479(-)